MDNAAVFAIAALCFADCGEDEWASVTEPAAWNDFLASARRLLQEDGDVSDEAPIARMRRSEPFSEFLADDEVRALYAPPTFDEKARFFARHFTGGLPASAMPVESLHVAWTADPARNPFGRAEGLYESDAALYMRDLIARLGLDEDACLSPYADHLAVELDLAALLLRANRATEAWLFVDQRLSWLSSYRAQLIGLGPDALFHLAIVDLVLGIRARQTARLSEGEAERR